MADSKNWPYLARLVQAILTRVRSRNGYVNKTKLLKYLYLIDIEHHRVFGRTLTGFQWIFYKFGPWTSEYDDFYFYLQGPNVDAIRARATDFESEMLATTEDVDLGDLFDSIAEGSRVRQIIDLWADRKLGEMLDYVYFHTEPMDEAARNEPLDFGKILRREELPRQPVSTEEHKSLPPSMTALRERLKRAIDAGSARKAESTTPPRYDEVFFRGVSALDEDAEY